MYSIEQRYTSHTHPERSLIRVLPRRYKKIEAAEKAAGQFRWVCQPQGIRGPVTEESSAVVIRIED